MVDVDENWPDKTSGRGDRTSGNNLGRRRGEKKCTRRTLCKQHGEEAPCGRGGVVVVDSRKTGLTKRPGGEI